MGERMASLEKQIDEIKNGELPDVKNPVYDEVEQLKCQDYIGE